MSFPSFNAGEVLTAADMNAVGLWLVSTTTIGTGVTSVPVNNCFSSNYQNYRVVISGMNASATGNSAFIVLQGSLGATYFGGGYFMTYGSTVVNGATFNGVALGLWAGITGTGFTATMDITRPNLATPTGMVGLSSGSQNTNSYQTYDSNAVAQTGFNFVQVGGPTMTGGVIRVYGYRN